MKNIFIGFIFTLLDFSLNLGTSKLGLIPDFIGYIYLIKGIDELASQSNTFAKARPYAFCMVVYTLVLYALDLFGIQLALGWLGVMLGIVKTVIAFYITYIIISGIKDIETNRGVDLNAGKLKTVWLLSAILGVSLYIIVIIPMLATAIMIVYFVVVIVFLVQLYRSKQLYEALPPLEFKPDNTL